MKNKEINCAKLSKLIKLSRKYINLPKGRAKHFTFIMRRNKVIAMGYNSNNKTHPIAHRFAHRFNCVHSELAAIVDFPLPIRKLYLFDLINIRLRKDGSIGLAKPCKCCTHMLQTFGVTNVYYTNEIGSVEQVIL